MSTSSDGRVRTRAQRVASRVAYEGAGDKFRRAFLQDAGLLKLGFAALTAFLIGVVGTSWNPPFAFRMNSKPTYDVVSRVAFQMFSPDKTNEAKKAARFETPHIYVRDSSKLTHYKAQLLNYIQTLISYPDFAAVSQEDRDKLRQFLPPNATDAELEAAFLHLQQRLEKDLDLTNFKDSLDRVFKPLEAVGTLAKMHGARDGNQEFIRVYNNGDDPSTAVKLSALEALIGNAYAVKDLLNREYNDRELVDLLFQKIRTSLPETLTENRAATIRAQNEAESRVDPVYARYDVGNVLVRSDTPIGTSELRVLRAEHQAHLDARSLEERFERFLAVFTILSLMFFGAYFLFNRQLMPTFAVDVRRSPSLRLCFVVLSATLVVYSLGRVMQVVFLAQGGATELIPLLMFVQTVAIATSWGVALSFGSIIAFALVVSGGGGYGMTIVFLGTSTVVALASRNVRTRSQLLGVAFAAGFFAFVLTTATELSESSNDRARVLEEASYHGVWALLAGFLTSGVLPIVERVFGVLTPMRLLEFGNPSHPLLLELNRRAPATYSHSIQTAAIAEAAAEAIGARASLIRVGAYFHDVGKMLQPEHFTENQRGYNIHDDLEPRMSALVIVAHVKDGSDLAKRYRLPRQIIDLLEQHHGTMLVSFFYQRANKLAQGSLPAGQKLDEGPFRYPGPIPQTKEAGILMLADAVESASRSVGEASPGRIENLVRQIADARIEDGQLNDSGLTLGEIRTVEKSLVTSILASRHSRVKYPPKEPVANKPAARDARDAKDAEGAGAPKISEDAVVPTDLSGASADVAPLDEYEFVRIPAAAPISPTSASEPKKSDDRRSGKTADAAKGRPNAAKPAVKPAAIEFDLKPFANKPASKGKTGSVRAYPKSPRGKKKR